MAKMIAPSFLLDISTSLVRPDCSGRPKTLYATSMRFVLMLREIARFGMQEGQHAAGRFWNSGQVNEIVTGTSLLRKRPVSRNLFSSPPNY